eukprot:jgi/Hompol1/6773/HPOL_005079-RA
MSTAAISPHADGKATAQAQNTSSQGSSKPAASSRQERTMPPFTPSQHPLTRFFITGKFADAVLRVRSLVDTAYVVDVPIHRVILASQSHFFDTLFSQAPEDDAILGDFEERTRKCGVWSIAVKSDASIRILLEWAYLHKASLTRESCWSVLALSHRLFMFDLEDFTGKWIVQNLLASPPGTYKPTTDWFEFIIGALRAEVSDDLIDNLVSAAVTEEQDQIVGLRDGADRTFHHYGLLRNLVRTSELLKEPLSQNQVRHLFRTVDYSCWSKEQLQQAYMDGLLPRDKISARLALGDSRNKPVAKVAVAGSKLGNLETILQAGESQVAVASQVKESDQPASLAVEPSSSQNDAETPSTKPETTEAESAQDKDTALSPSSAAAPISVPTIPGAYPANLEKTAQHIQESPVICAPVAIRDIGPPSFVSATGDVSDLISSYSSSQSTQSHLSQSNIEALLRLGDQLHDLPADATLDKAEPVHLTCETPEQGLLEIRQQLARMLAEPSMVPINPTDAGSDPAAAAAATTTNDAQPQLERHVEEYSIEPEEDYLDPDVTIMAEDFSKPRTATDAPIIPAASIPRKNPTPDTLRQVGAKLLALSLSIQEQGEQDVTDEKQTSTDPITGQSEIDMVKSALHLVV